MERRFKIGDYLRIVKDTGTDTRSGTKVGDIVKVVNLYNENVHGFLVEVSYNGGVRYSRYEDRFELADDYILKELWK